MHRFIDRYGRWLTLDWHEVERGDALFRKHGSIIVLVARMLPTFRSLISIPAGLFGMSLRRFLVFSTIGTAGWSAALAGAGYFLGSPICRCRNDYRPAFDSDYCVRLSWAISGGCGGGSLSPRMRIQIFIHQHSGIDCGIDLR